MFIKYLKTSLKLKKQLGLVNQSEIEDLLKLQNELNIQKGKLQKEMELYEEGILKLQKEFWQLINQVSITKK